MIIYPTLDAALSFQNCGSVWLMILRGKENDILTAFNGLWNLKATSGELDFTTHDKTVAKFWSSPVKMREFFFNTHYLKFDSTKHANLYADMQMAELAKHSHVFQSFRGFSLSDAFNMGTTSAERPDHDFKDSTWANENKGLATSQKVA